MYGGLFLVFAMILVLLSPVIWVAWWLLADLGEKMSGSAAETNETWEKRLRPAA